MSNGHKLEILPGVDDVVYLNFWDNRHGEDVIFVLKPDNTAIRQDWSQVADDDTPPTEVSVDLVQALRELSAWLVAERGDE